MNDVFITRGINLEQVRTISVFASDVVGNFAEKYGGTSTGGYLYIINDNGKELCHTKIGTPNAKQNLKAYSRSNALRLLCCPKHFLSWQSRQPEMNELGGAIRLPYGDIFSFAGFPEMTNEVFVASMARILNLINDYEVKRRLALSSNISHYMDVHYFLSELASRV